MLRRYLVLNGVSTVVLYGVVATVTPHLLSMAQSLHVSATSLILQSQTLGPILYRFIAPWA